MRGLFPLALSCALVTVGPLLSSGLTIGRLDFGGPTDRPTPGTIVFFQITDIQPSDPETADVFIRDARRGNVTEIFHNFVLETSDKAVPGFEIPSHLPTELDYIIRLTDPNNRNITLADSPSFRLWPRGTPPSTTSQPDLSSSPVPSPSRSATNEPEEESNLPVGVIVGGSVGGVVILILFFVLLWLLLKKRSPPPAANSIVEPSLKPQHTANSNISPFFIPTADGGNAAHATFTESIPMTSSTNSFSRTDFSSSTNEKARLRAQQAARDQAAFASHPTSDGASTSSDHLLNSQMERQSSSASNSRRGSSKAAMLRADQLRRERERLDREIADLENQSIRSGGNASQSGSATRVNTASVYVPLPDEPPPEYSRPLPQPLGGSSSQPLPRKS